MIYYTKYFIINLTFFGHYSWLPELKGNFKMGCMIFEVEECDSDLILYTYHWLFFDRYIKKRLTKVFLSNSLNYFNNHLSRNNNKFTSTFPGKLTKVEILEKTLSYYKDSFGKDVIGYLVNSMLQEYYSDES